MIWRGMRLQSVGPILPALARTKGLKLSVLLLVAVPALVGLTAISTLADTSPTPPASGAPLPGDPAKGATLYATNPCSGCHGSSLGGNIGPSLNPIAKLTGVPDGLDPAFLIDIITNGRKHTGNDPGTGDMPPKGGNANLTEQDVKDLAAFIIEQNRNPGGGPLSPNELAKRTMLWVGIGIAGMLFITLLLAQYNMRWIARRAAARRK
jgi:mono/diheme cytochrome c family protein